MEQRMASLQDENKALMQERDFYRSERDFYRENFNRSVPISQLPSRPASPGTLRLSEASGETRWHGSEGPANPLVRGTIGAEIPATTRASPILAAAATTAAPPRSSYPSTSSSQVQSSMPPTTALPPYRGAWPPRGEQ